MTIQERLQDDMKTAMRAKDQQRLDTIRMALAALKNMRIEKGAELDEADAMAVLHKEAKRRRDAANEYRQVNRADLAEQEEAELAIIEAYLPQQLSADELRPQVQAIINEVGATGPGDMSKVMPVLMERFRGQADGRVLSQLTRELLSTE